MMTGRVVWTHTRMKGWADGQALEDEWGKQEATKDETMKGTGKCEIKTWRQEIPIVLNPCYKQPGEHLAAEVCDGGWGGISARYIHSRKQNHQNLELMMPVSIRETFWGLTDALGTTTTIIIVIITTGWQMNWETREEQLSERMVKKNVA